MGHQDLGCAPSFFWPLIIPAPVVSGGGILCRGPDGTTTLVDSSLLPKCASLFDPDKGRVHKCRDVGRGGDGARGCGNPADGNLSRSS